MAHHKRKRPKHQRAGCLFCKPWKDERGGGRGAENQYPRYRASDWRKLQEPIPSVR